MRTYRYYIASGRSLDICRQIRAEQVVAIEQLKVILKETGADNAHGSPRIVGLTFPEGKRPEGWKSYVRNYSKMLMPDKRRKDLKPMRDRIEAIRMPGSEDLHNRLGFDLCITNEERDRGMVILYTGAETIGGTVVLKVPVNADGRIDVPADAQPLKASEYWRMKEEHGEPALA